jgi:RNA polymerase sigma-70 factor (ECF subfamily)
MEPPFQDIKSFKKLYLQYFSVLVNFAFSRTSDWELSREIVQNTFAKLWERKHSTEIKTSVKSYLFMMVRNSIIDHFRQTNRFSEISDKMEMMEEKPENGFSSEEILFIRHAIKKGLNEMKPKRRLIFELSKFEGLTYAEIANHLGISERAVEDNMAKALNQLKELLKDHLNQIL